ncbi:ParB/RepB/Spo0J family partition protein [Sphingobacterium sp.]|uniref:ParB/RepB/Spo0J family partition protein n=1 Tax=Sphingobacterium sp. TaxID=341027 RepID=UPI0031E03E63
MVTTAIKKPVRKPANPKNALAKYDLQSIKEDGTFSNIAINQIDTCSFNYRKYYDEAELQELADDITQHGIIHPLTLRKSANGRFELVVGERRFRAAKIAKRKTVPAMIKLLTDEQVIELMLAENLNRVDPHPLHEAEAIHWMHKTGKSIEEIALRLVKSKAFVYNRLKWAELILPLKEMFLANKFSIQDANELSLLAPESQQEFFEIHCNDWVAENYSFNNCRYAISRFKYDLKKAPFDTKDKTVLPEAGACTNCPFNSATRKSLFPELAKEAVCSHKVCYKKKCISHSERSIRLAIQEHKPTAFITYGDLSEEMQILIDSMPEVNALSEHSYYDINICKCPTAPDKEDYWTESEDGEEEPDIESYDAAVDEYKDELAAYECLIETGSILKGLFIKNGEVSILNFNFDKKSTISSKTVTAKEVQEAIKAGTVTAELLEAEIKRIEEREKRALELDSIKIQKQAHEDFCTKLEQAETLEPMLTNADLIAARLLVFQSLDWSMKRKIEMQLFTDVDTHAPADFYTALADLNEQQYAHLIRAAISGKAESKIPGYVTAFSFYKMADAAGINVADIEKSQKTLADERKHKVKQKIEDLQRKIKKLTPET